MTTQLIKAARHAAPSEEHALGTALRRLARRIGWHPWRLLLPAALLAMAALSYLLQERLARDDAAFRGDLQRQQVLAQQVGRAAAELAVNPDTSVDAILERERRARGLLARMPAVEVPLHLWRPPPGIEEKLQTLDQAWLRLGEALRAIISERAARDELEQALARFKTTATRMLMTGDDVVAAMAAAEAPPEQMRIAARQLMLVERMIANGERMLRGGRGLLTATDRLGRDAVLFGEVNTGMLSGNRELGVERVRDEAVRELLETAGRQFRAASEQVEVVVERALELTRLDDAVARAARETDAIGAITRDITTLHDDYLATRPLQPAHTRALGALAGVSLLLMLVLMAFDARSFRQLEARRARYDELRRLASDDAIVADSARRDIDDELERLVTDLGRVVEIDTAPRFGEDPNDSLARALRQVLAELHARVDAIVTGAHQVASGASGLQEAASRLTSSGRQQTQQVDKAAASTQELASAVKLGAATTAKLEALAESAIGEVRAVRTQVSGATEDLEKLAASVQETSRVVRRVLESAQEARSVAHRIDELSDHSKMLSLNVAIQSSAEAHAARPGASFADELQRLAERARALVQTVETMRERLRGDADDAVKAVKQTAWTVKSAGERLRRSERPIANLQQLSRRLEKIAQSLAGTSQEHTVKAAEVVRAVTAVHAVAAQTSVGAESAAGSAARLGELVAALQAQLSRLHAVPVTGERAIVELSRERDERERSDEARASESTRARSANLRPIS